MRTNWNNLLAVGIFLTTHPLSLLHQVFFPFSTTSSRQLTTEQPLWFLYPKIKRLWRGDCWPVRTWCIIHSYTITSSQPVTVSLSRSLTGLQLISPNPSHTSPRINYLLGCFVQSSSCCDINKTCVLSSITMLPIFICAVARIAKKSQLVRIMWLQGAANTNNPIFGIWGNKWYDCFDKLKRKLWTCIECRECEIELKYIRVQDGVWS